MSQVVQSRENRKRLWFTRLNVCGSWDCLSNSRAVLEAVMGRESIVRTPKMVEC